jgi:hypothetical protein
LLGGQVPPNVLALSCGDGEAGDVGCSAMLGGTLLKAVTECSAGEEQSEDQKTRCGDHDVSPYNEKSPPGAFRKHPRENASDKVLDSQRPRIECDPEMPVPCRVEIYGAKKKRASHHRPS